MEQYPVEGAGPSDPSSGGVVLVPANPGLVVVFRSEVKVHGRDQRRGEDPGPPFRALHPAHRRPAPHRDPRGAGEDFAEQVVHAPRLQGGYPAERPIQPRPDIIAGGARDDSIHPQPAEFLRDGALHRARTRSEDIPARPPPPPPAKRSRATLPRCVPSVASLENSDSYAHGCWACDAPGSWDRRRSNPTSRRAASPRRCRRICRCPNDGSCGGTVTASRTCRRGRRAAEGDPK